MSYYDKAIELNMDGMVFYGVGSDPYDINCRFYKECTTEELKELNIYPRSDRAFYKIEGLTRNYYNFYGKLIKPKIILINTELEAKAMSIVNTINEVNMVSVKQRQSTNDMLFDYVLKELEKLSR